MTEHAYIDGAGQTAHHEIDNRLPSPGERDFLTELAGDAPASVSGARDDPEAALANLLAALDALGLITDNTTAS
jgi:hypothetical protein